MLHSTASAVLLALATLAPIASAAPVISQQQGNSTLEARQTVDGKSWFATLTLDGSLGSDGTLSDTAWTYYSAPSMTPGGGAGSAGATKYVDRDTARSRGLISSTNSGGLRLQVDTADGAVNDRQRNSIRIEGRQHFQRYMMVADVNHIPTGLGTWPAIWMLAGGSDMESAGKPVWPAGGEVDLVEAHDDSDTNTPALHTDDFECLLGGRKGEGNDHPYWTQPEKDRPSGSFGPKFNDNGGGVFAVRNDPRGIGYWFFPRDKVPSALSNAGPWIPENTDDYMGKPHWWMSFNDDNGKSQCTRKNAYDRFGWMRPVINIELCGSSNKVNYDECLKSVQNNPSAYADAYWDIQSIKIFTPGLENQPQYQLE